MFCKNCGSSFENQDYCPYCGTFAVQENSGSQYPGFGQAPSNNSYGQTQNNNGYGNMQGNPRPYNSQRSQVPEKLTDDGSHKTILVMGILSLAFSAIVFLGPIFGIIAIVSYIRYLKYYGNISGQAMVGFILAIVGVLFSVLFFSTVYYPICAGLKKY